MFLAAAKCDGGHVIGEGSLGPWGAQGLGGPLCSGHAIYTYTSHTLKCTHAVSADITRVHTRHTCSHVYARSPVRAHTPSSHNTQQHTFTRYVCKYAPCPFSHAHAFAQQYTRSCACKYTPHSTRARMCTHTHHARFSFNRAFIPPFFLSPSVPEARGVADTWPVLSDLVRGMNGRGGGRSALRRALWETAQLARRSNSGPRGRTASWAGPRGRQTDRPRTGRR